MHNKSTKNTQSSKKKHRKSSKIQNQKPFPILSMQKRVAWVLKQHMSKISEGRRDDGGAFKYLISDFAIAVIVAIVRGCVSQGNAIVEFWKGNIDFLHSIGLFVNEKAKGDVPSVATFYRLSGVLDSKAFRDCLFDFVTRISLTKIRRGLNVLAVDGKTMCGTSCGESGKPIHILTAFLQALSIPINCVSCSEKSNEITAWQELLKLLDKKCAGMVFTSDAMGCQKQIVDTIIDKGGNYCLALKGNHPTFEREARDMIARGINWRDQYCEEETLSHGRIEKRICTVYSAVYGDSNQYITDLKDWRGIRSIVHIKAYRTDKKTGSSTVSDERIYISNLEETARNFNSIIRNHWSVEVFHHVLDTDFQQDSIKRRNDIKSHSSRNLDLFQKAAYILLKLYDLLLSKIDGNRRLLGIRKMMHRANANNRMISDIFNLDLSSLGIE